MHLWKLSQEGCASWDALFGSSDALAAGVLPQPCLTLWDTAPQGHPVGTDKALCTAQAAGGLSATAVATSVLPGGCCPQTLPTAHSPQPTPTGPAGKKGASSSRACGNPGITSPNLAEGCPEEKMLGRHCLKQWPGAAVKTPKAFLALSTGSLPDAEGGDFFFSLSFRS